jgi:hypothetical protein
MSLPPQQGLYRLLAPILERNRRFRNRHEGETCYILGNGGSLRYMDLLAFNDHPSIGLNSICIHRDFHALRVPYYVIADPFMMYPLFRSSYRRKIEWNVVGRMIKRTLRQYPDINLFTSVSNLPAMGFRNCYYTHHFGHRTPDRHRRDLDGPFSFMAGAFYMGMALAVYLGFKKAILLGCDYMCSPTAFGHFYSAAPLQTGETMDTLYVDLLRELDSLIELLLVTVDRSSAVVPVTTYQALTGREPFYRENHDIVAARDLDQIQDAYNRGQYQLPVYPSSR